MINICITADYEVFLKKNYGTIDEVLISPTNYATEKLNSIGIPITFFVDTLYVGFLKKNKYIVEYERIKENVRFLYASGNAIELHIHPHWPFTTLKDDEFFFDSKYYRVSEIESICGLEKMKEIVEDALYILKEDLMGTVNDYSCKSYRAGGWSVQPENQIMSLLRDNEIMVDTSVLRNSCSGKGKMEYYDFRNVPSQTWWYFNIDKKITEEVLDISESSMMEISVYSVRGIQSIIHRLAGIIKRKVYRSENTIKQGESCLENKNIIEKIVNLFKEPIKFSLDNKDDICYYFRHLSKIHFKSNEVVCFYFHPKLITTEAIDVLVEEIYKLNKNEYNFVTVPEIYEKLSKI